MSMNVKRRRRKTTARKKDMEKIFKELVKC